MEFLVEFAEYVGPIETTDPVAFAVAAAGTRYVCTAVGRLLNHPGVCPAWNSDASCEDTAGEFVSASWMSEEGKAVCRTEMTEALPTILTSTKTYAPEYILLQFGLLLALGLTLGLTLALAMSLVLGGSCRRKGSHSQCLVLHYGQALLN